MALIGPTESWVTGAYEEAGHILACLYRSDHFGVEPGAGKHYFFSFLQFRLNRRGNAKKPPLMCQMDVSYLGRFKNW